MRDVDELKKKKKVGGWAEEKKVPLLQSINILQAEGEQQPVGGGEQVCV